VEWSALKPIRLRNRICPAKCEVTGNVLWQELECDEAMQPRIFGLVDDTHAATAQLLDDAVVRDDLVDHSWRILRLRNGQVNEGHGVGGGSRELLL